MKFNVGDYIGFKWFDGQQDVLIVDQISSIACQRYVVHFLVGYRSMAELITDEEVLVKGDSQNGTVKLKGWSGQYTIVQRTSLIESLIYEELKEKTDEIP